MSKTSNKILVVIAIVALISAIIFAVIKANNKKDKFIDTSLKNYEVNQYIPTYVSAEDMAKIYLNDYVHNMFYNIEEAYNSLDSEYRLKKFGNINSYKSYVYNLEQTAFVVSRYSKMVDGNYEIFKVYDTYGNLYIFKTSGVLQYVVYLDEDTVEI